VVKENAKFEGHVSRLIMSCIFLPEFVQQEDEAKPVLTAFEGC
jgi:hypothetical protein